MVCNLHIRIHIFCAIYMLFVSYLCLHAMKLCKYYLCTIYKYYKVVYKYYIHISMYKLYMAHVPLLLLLGLHTNICNHKWCACAFIHATCMFLHIYIQWLHIIMYSIDTNTLTCAHFTDWTQIVLRKCLCVIFYIYNYNYMLQILCTYLSRNVFTCIIQAHVIYIYIYGCKAHV